MVCEVWIQDLNQNYNGSLYSGSNTRRGHKVTISATVCKFSVWLRKVGSPTGTLTSTIRKVSDDNIIETSGDTLDVSTLTTSYVEHQFTFNSAVAEEVRLLVEYSGGNIGNCVEASAATSDSMAGQYTRYSGSYFDVGTYEMTCRIWTETVGGLSIPVAIHHYSRINKVIRG